MTEHKCPAGRDLEVKYLELGGRPSYGVKVLCHSHIDVYTDTLVGYEICQCSPPDKPKEPVTVQTGPPLKP
jgi:hypothetical protein